MLFSLFHLALEHFTISQNASVSPMSRITFKVTDENGAENVRVNKDSSAVFASFLVYLTLIKVTMFVLEPGLKNSIFVLIVQWSCFILERILLSFKTLPSSLQQMLSCHMI